MLPAEAEALAAKVQYDQRLKDLYLDCVSRIGAEFAEIYTEEELHYQNLLLDYAKIIDRIVAHQMPLYGPRDIAYISIKLVKRWSEE